MQFKIGRTVKKKVIIFVFLKEQMKFAKLLSSVLWEDFEINVEIIDTSSTDRIKLRDIEETLRLISKDSEEEKKIIAFIKSKDDQLTEQLLKKNFIYLDDTYKNSIGIAIKTILRSPF